MRQHAGGTPALPGGAAAPPRQFQNSTLSKQTGMLSKRNDEHEKILCPSCRGFCRGNDLPVRLRKKNGNSAGKIRRQLSAARPAAGGGLHSRAIRAGGWSSPRSAIRKPSIPSPPTSSRPRRFTGICSPRCSALTGRRSQVSPGLADSWTNSPDGKTWTFQLRKNLRWSDGDPLDGRRRDFHLERRDLQPGH